MRRTAFLLPLGCLFFALACSKEERSNPIPGDDADPGDTAGYDVHYDTGTRPDGDASGGDGTSEGGDTSGSTACAKSYPGVKPTLVSYPHSAKGQSLAAITWDELTMAWTSGDSTSGVVVHYSDRSGRDVAFTADMTLPTTLGPFAQDKVVLTPDGLTMIFASADHKTLRQITRGSRGAAFDETTATSAPFSYLMSPGEGGSSRAMADLVLTKSGKYLFFTDLGRTVGTTLMVSAKMSDGKWDMPTAVESTRFHNSGGMRRRPTGYSSDARTLFFYDETTQTTWLAFTDPSSLSFTEFVPFLPEGSGAMPSDSCDRVYLTIRTKSTVDAGPDVRVDPDPPEIFRAP